MRILAVAEPFGYGPAAALHHIRCQYPEGDWTFAGSHHSLHLSHSFHRTIDLTTTLLHPEDYDVAVVAMDLAAAEHLTSSLPVIFYDALAWFWDSTPQAVQHGATWACQNFFTVPEIVQQTNDAGLAAHLISPLTHRGNPEGEDRPIVSLGGLRNPFMPDEVTDLYAVKIAEAVTLVAQELSLPSPLFLASNPQILQREGYDATRKTPEETADLFASSPLVWATPGLGHMNDAATNATRVCWLPPANDSQARQLALAVQHEVVDGAAQWDTAIPDDTQPQRLLWITDHILSADPRILASRLLPETLRTINSPSPAIARLAHLHSQGMTMRELLLRTAATVGDSR